MKKTVRFLLCAGLMLPATNAFAAASGAAGTGDYSDRAQEDKAIEAALAAGYNPTILESDQNGSFLLTATKNGGSYDVTVTPDGKVIPVTPGAPAG